MKSSGFLNMLLEWLSLPAFIARRGGVFASLLPTMSCKIERYTVRNGIFRLAQISDCIEW